MTRRTALSLRALLPLLALLAGPAVTPAAAENAAASGRYYLPVVVACRPDPGDKILEFICRRIAADAPELAHARGMTLSVEGPVHPRDHWQAPRDTLALEVLLTGTRPASQFAQKEITARLIGPPLGGGENWSTGIAATGVPRDLVHPVADAVLANIDAFLGRRAAVAANQR
ncbi:MAG: hypothetical protein PVG91_12140 [Gammaproteobacteria bacterium]